MEAGGRRLPGAPGDAEKFRAALDRLPEDVVRGSEEARRLLDAALARARQAAEDRTGPEREDARRRLNAASLAAERAGAAASDAAREARKRKAAEVLAAGGR